MSWVRPTSALCTTLLVVLLIVETMPARADDAAVMDHHGTMVRRRSVPGRCVSLPSNMTLCRGVGYNRVRLPNLFGHERLAEATEQANSWVLLVNIHCHPDTQVVFTHCSHRNNTNTKRILWNPVKMTSASTSYITRTHREMR